MRLMLVVAFVFGAVVALGATALAGHDAFTDVPDNHVHAEGIHWASGRLVVQGFGDGTFRPNNPVTRGQVATMVQRAQGVSYTLTPICGTFDFVAREHSGRGSGPATVTYSVNGGDRTVIDAIEGDEDTEFTVSESGVVDLYVDSVAQASAHSAENCTE
jgi:hypothetical protein